MTSRQTQTGTLLHTHSCDCCIKQAVNWQSKRIYLTKSLRQRLRLAKGLSKMRTFLLWLLTLVSMCHKLIDRTGSDPASILCCACKLAQHESSAC